MTDGITGHQTDLARGSKDINGWQGNARSPMGLRLAEAGDDQARQEH